VKIRVITAGLTGLARRSSITRARLTGLTKITTQTGKLIGLAKLLRLAQTAAQIDGQIRLSGLATRRIKKEVPVVLLTWKSGLRRIWPTWKAGLQKIWLTQKVGLRKIRITRKAGLRKIRLTQKTGLYRTRGARSQKKEKVLLQAKVQLHDGAQGVLPRHKNID
jgi:hypothetical protein